MHKYGRLRGYVIAVLAAVASIALTQVTWNQLGLLPYAWPMLASLLLMLCVGWGPGLVCAVVGSIYIDWRNVDGQNSFDVHSLPRLLLLFGLLILSSGIRFRYDQATKSNKRGEDILTAAAHELLNPLSSALLSLQVHKMGGPLKLNVIENALRRAARLVDSMLDLAKSKRDAQYRVETFDLVEELRSLARLYCPHAIVAAPRPIPITCNRVGVEHVFGNLLSNAKKYGGDDPVEVKIVLEGAYAVVTVRDHGRGLSEEEIKRMFDKYARFDSTKQGLGLGLWIVAENIKAMQGRVQVKSEKDKGTCVEVALPLVR
jgi:signal transduction histidine kinase